MANRFRNRNYGRGDYGNRSNYGRGRYGSDYNRYGSTGFGGYDYDREENYFGGGGSLGYGGGFTGTSYDRGYSSYNRDFEDEYTPSSQERRGSPRFSRRGRNFDREDYYGGGYRGSDDYNRGNYGGYYGQSDYDDERGFGGGNYSNDRSYGRRYMNDEGDYESDDRGFFEKAGDEVASWFGDEEATRRRRMDTRQSHRGRGPRNYTRSDDRIKEDINDRLTDDYFLDASEIDVEVNGGEVILTGTVDSRWAKRHAEDIAEDVSGVTHCENRIRVNESFYGQSDSSFTNTNTGTSTGTSATGSTSTTGSTATTTAKSRSKSA